MQTLIKGDPLTERRLPVTQAGLSSSVAPGRVWALGKFASLILTYL